LKCRAWDTAKKDRANDVNPLIDIFRHFVPFGYFSGATDSATLGRFHFVEK